MAFNTALGLCLAAVSLLLASWSSRSRRAAAWARDASLLSAGLVGTLATLTLMETITGIGLGIDGIFVCDWLTRHGIVPNAPEVPGRMSQATALALLLLSLALGFCTTRGLRASLKWASLVCAAAAVSVGLLAGGAMVLAEDGTAIVPLLSSMAPLTAWLVVLLGSGIVVVELVGFRTGSTMVGVSSRRVTGVWLTMTVVLVFAPGVLVTAMVAKQTAAREVRAAEARFERLTDRIVREANRRVRLPLHSLNGMRGMYAGSNRVTREEFRAYVEQQNLSVEYPGTIGIGFIERVPREELAAFEARERADGAAEFAVHPPSQHEVLYPIKYIEPLATNLPAWGFDVGSEANRRRAVERAIRTGEPMLTRQITLVQDETRQPGFLLLQAVYRQDFPFETPADRLAALEGVVYAPMLIEGIFDGLISEAEGGAQFAIYEGEEVSRSARLFEDLGVGGVSMGAGPSRLHQRALFTKTLSIDAVGQPWTIEMVSSPALDAAAMSPQSTTVAVYGLILSSVAAFFVWLLGCARAEALELAEDRTRDLQKITEDLRHSSEVIARQNVALGAMAERAHRVVDDVSHEFRTPLAVIKEFASIIDDGLAGPVTAKQAEYLKIMSGAVVDLNHMVEDLLDSSKLRAGRLRVERRSHRVEDIFSGCRTTLARKASSRGITVRERLEDGLPPVFADEEKVRRVISNLMTNAIKFSPEKSVIVLSAERRDAMGEVVIGVTDQGAGLSREEIDSLFGRFQQTSSGRRVTAKGFGLGLSIAQELTWLNLGRISVQSEKGRGATFSFTLPYDRLDTIVDHYFNTMASIERPDDRLVLLRVCAQAGGRPEEPASFLSSVTHPTDLLLRTESGVCDPAAEGSPRCWWILGRTGKVDSWVGRIREARREQIEQDNLDVAPLDVEVIKSWSYPAEVGVAQEEISHLLLGVPCHG